MAKGQQATARLRQAQPGNPNPRRILRVLWIDDEVPPEDPLIHLLQMDGLKVTVAHDGTNGLSIALSSAFDIVLLDLRLPDVFGLTVLERLLANDFRQPIIVVSGHYLEPELETMARRRGAAAVLYKPLAYDDLVSMLSSVLMSPHPRQGHTDAAGAVSFARDDLDLVCTRVLALESREHLLIALLPLATSSPSLVSFAGYADAFHLVASGPPTVAPEQRARTRDMLVHAAQAKEPKHPRLRAAFIELERCTTRQQHLSVPARVNLSEAYLSRGMTARCGRTYRTWRRLAIMRVAVRPVTATTEQISQIAFATGYEYLSQFDRDFVQTFGLSPREARRLRWSGSEHGEVPVRRPRECGACEEVSRS